MITDPISLRTNYLAAQDAVLAFLNEHYLPDMLRLSLEEGRWHYYPLPSKVKGACSTQGSYRLYFRYGDIYALNDLARIADVLDKNKIRFELAGLRNGDSRKLVLMVPETDLRRVINEDRSTAYEPV